MVAGVGRVLGDRHLGVVCCCFRGDWRLVAFLMASGYSCAFVWRPVALVGGVLGFGLWEHVWSWLVYGSLGEHWRFLGFFVGVRLLGASLFSCVCFLGLAVGASLLPEATGARQIASRGPRQPLELRAVPRRRCAAQEDRRAAWELEPANIELRHLQPELGALVAPAGAVQQVVIAGLVGAGGAVGTCVWPHRSGSAE